MTAAVELRQVSRTYGSGAGEVHALRELDLTVQPGELVAVMGPSGSGKTTLAKVLTGSIGPDLGTVRLDGAQLIDWDQDELARHIGFVPQEPSLFEGTVKENISRFSAPAARTSSPSAPARQPARQQTPGG